MSKSSAQDGGIGRDASVPCTTKRRTTMNKKQAELPEIQTAWKSDNQGVRETFIQTDSATMKLCELSLPGKSLRLHPLQHNRYTKTKKYGPNERRHQNSRIRTKQEGDIQPI